MDQESSGLAPKEENGGEIEARSIPRFDSIAFCGGGGKGAYHIGVWKALEELDALRDVRAVSGTSIGALNAVLFALGDYEKAKRIWYTISEEDVFTVKPEKLLVLAGAALVSTPLALAYAAEINESGMFTRDGLLAILDTLELSRLAECHVKVYVNVVRASTGELEWFELNSLPEDRQKSLLLATTSLPFIYGKQEVGGRKYWDGGIARLRDGNIPIIPLYENGCRDILISSLDSNFSFGPDQHPLKGPNAKARYPDANITALVPLESMGSFISGTLNFTPSAIRERMVMGYSDTKKQLMREDVYFMRNNFSRINIQIANQIERLFKTGDEFERFITKTNFGLINIPMSTLGGHVFYTDIVNIDGWRLQQHNVWPLKSHYRIIDPDDVRRAWVLSPDDILRALTDFEESGKFDTED